jgi:CHAT domain-containing protein
MNEQRTQAYLNLINQLLSCNEGDEPRILQENEELFDRGLIEVMVAVAQQLEEARRENEAQWLMNIAQQLAQALGLLDNNPTESANTPQDYLNFLMETLQKIEENPNPQLIHPFLAQNLKNLDENLITVLDDWTRTQLSSMNAKEANYIARLIFNFSNNMRLFPLGNIAINQKIAIIGYQSTLSVFTFEALPEDWARLQNNLGIIYSEKISGNKAENLEQAITFYQSALKVRSSIKYPKEWADTNNNLGLAYSERIKGDKADNLEQAIIFYQNSLKVFTFQDFPEEWAKIYSNMANIYSSRIKGNKSKNIEQAILFYQDALKFFTFKDFPEDWARVQNGLGIAYRNRIIGNSTENIEKAIIFYQNALKFRDFASSPQKWAMTQSNLASAYFYRIKDNKSENLEIAITHYQNSLKVYTYKNFPNQWADIQINLAAAYINRVKGDKSENLEMSIMLCKNALKVYTFDDFPDKWADTQINLALTYVDRSKGNKADNLEQAIILYKQSLKIYTFNKFPKAWADIKSNIANAYYYRIKGDKAKNLEKSINYHKEALLVRTFDDFPQEWARTQNDLAVAYSNRIRGNKSDNLEQAIIAYNESLKVYTFEDFPQDWAGTQNNLAAVHYSRVKGDKNENLKKAINYYQNSLKIRSKDGFPLDCLLTARNLGILYYNENQWREATKAYQLAIKALENARLEALNPQSRQEVLSNAIDVFHRIVQAHLNINQPEKALEYIERSKGRNLVELMTQKNLQPQGVSQEIIEQLNELKQRVVNEQIRLQSQSINQNLMRSDNLNSYVQDQNYLKQYQQELDNFIERKIKPIDPLFSLTQKVEPIPFVEIQALTNAETCLLQWYITREKILAFVVSADGEVKVWQSSEEDTKQLIDAINNYLQLYYSENGKAEWRNQLSSLLQTFADILHINDILDLIPDNCKRLIIIPHLFLHILPLHAFPISQSHVLKFGAVANAQDLHDLFPNGVQYAPSCQLLQIAQSFQHFDFNKLFAIQNPTKDLLYTDLEVNILSNFFTESQIIAKDNATKNAIIPHLKSSNNHCHHFSCHGDFNPNNPFESALFLANKEPLTLGEIFELRLNQCRLVTLSACETGLIDLNSISDEYIGLPSGFLFAGSPSVVSSLWTVNDLSTSFLMIKFYEILFNVNLNISVAVALKEAQDWLQNLTIEKLDKFLEQYQPQIDKYLSPLRLGQRKIYQESLKQIRQRQPHPFANPYYWAGFTATGI